MMKRNHIPNFSMSHPPYRCLAQLREEAEKSFRLPQPVLGVNLHTKTKPLGNANRTLPKFARNSRASLAARAWRAASRLASCQAETFFWMMLSVVEATAD